MRGRGEGCLIIIGQIIIKKTCLASCCFLKKIGGVFFSLFFFNKTALSEIKEIPRTSLVPTDISQQCEVAQYELAAHMMCAASCYTCSICMAVTAHVYNYEQ